MTVTAADPIARRFAPFPSREDFPEDEKPAYDSMMDKWIRPFRAWPESDEGRGHVLRYFQALMAVPNLGLAVMAACDAVTTHEGRPGTISRADHEIIDQVLALDSGYFGLVGWHTQEAPAAGVRIEAMAALADGREEDFTPDERQQVAFVRAVRDGAMTDDIWQRMRTRLGTDRGVVDYAALVLLLVFHHRFAWALGVPELPHDDWRQMLDDFKNSRRDSAAICDARVAAIATTRNAADAAS
jgi:hypothetical protein